MLHLAPQRCSPGRSAAVMVLSLSLCHIYWQEPLHVRAASLGRIPARLVRAHSRVANSCYTTDFDEELASDMPRYMKMAGKQAGWN